MSKHTAGRISSKHISLCLSAILYSSLFVPPPALLAQDPQQDVAEAARREKARKAALQKKNTHVYTNEDLQQSRILTDEDRERVEARKNDPANAPNQPVLPSFDVENSPAPESLGEIARRYRAEKAQREAEETAKSLSPLFPMTLSAPAFAEPLQPVEAMAPPTAPAPARTPSFSLIAPTAAPAKMVPWKNSQPAARTAKPLKRDPFAPQIAVPSLRSSRPDLSTNLPVPAKPALPLANVSPHAPAARVENPATAPALSIPAVPGATQLETHANVPRRPATLNGNPSVAPALPKSHPATVVPSAPQMKSPAAAPAAPLAVAPDKHLTPPSIAPQVGIAAPGLPKPHVAPLRVPKLSLPGNTSAAPSVETVEKQPLRPAVPHDGAGRPYLPQFHASNITVAKLAPSSELKSLPPVLAGELQPAVPALTPLLEMAAPAVPKPTVSAAPRVLAPSSPAPVAPILGARVAPNAPLNQNRNTMLVEAGDSLWKLARRRLGRGSRWSEFLAINPGIVDPALLQPGSELIVPADEPHHRTLRENALLVHRGDSLWKLALVYFGKGTGWTCLAQTNPQLQNPNRLQPGQVLNLPTSCSR